MDRIMTGGQEPQTWAQSIQAYQRDKTTLSWNPAEVPPPTYVKQYDVSRKNREIDPVLMRHRDPDVEAGKKNREEERMRTALNNAKSRQLRVEQNYDIVTHSPHFPASIGQGQESVARPTRHPDTRTSYDILNHVSRADAHSLALIYDEGESPEVLPQKVVTVDGGKKPHSHLRRDVDIVSNRFLKEHDERMLEEKGYLRKQAEEKYRRTHDYDPISGKYYDESKEQNFVHSRATLQTLQGRAQQHRLPPSIRYGEGNDYDIISKQPKVSTAKGEVAAVDDRGVNKRAHGRHIHEEHIRQHERTAAISEQRALNRPSHMRHVEVLRTGHDVISNQVFTGREGRPPPQPRARPPVPVWDRLSGGVQLGAGSTSREVEESATREGRGGSGGGGDSGSGGEGRRTNRGDGEYGRNDSGRLGSNDAVGRQEYSIASRSHQQQESNGVAPREREVDGETASIKKQVVPQLDLARQIAAEA